MVKTMTRPGQSYVSALLMWYFAERRKGWDPTVECSWSPPFWHGDSLVQRSPHGVLIGCSARGPRWIWHAASWIQNRWFWTRKVFGYAPGAAFSPEDGY